MLDLPIMKYFAYEHLPEPMRSQSAKFKSIADGLIANYQEGDDIAELVVSLRKLLEAKDAAVRSILGRVKRD